MSAASVAALRKQSRREDGKVQRNDVKVILGPADKNPVYVLTVKRDENVLKQIALRFGPYRDLFEKLNGDKSCDKLLTAPFPPTTKLSAIGLSQKQLLERASGLDTWAKDLFENFNEFTSSGRQAISEFVGIPESELELIVIVETPPPPPPGPVPIDSDKNKPLVAAAATTEVPKKRMSVLAAVGLVTTGFGKKSEKTVDSPSGDTESIASGWKLIGGKTDEPTPPPPVIPKITVYVSRGALHKGHPTYETVFKFGIGERPLIIANKEFKHYRDLMTSLRKFGIGDETAPAAPTDRRSSFLRVSSSASTVDEISPITVSIDYPFPETKLKSSIGGKMTEEELTERAVVLDRWVRNVCETYFLFDFPAKDLFNSFIGFTEDSDDEKVQYVVERLNVEGAFNPNPPPVKKAALKIDADEFVVGSEESDENKSALSESALKTQSSVGAAGSSFGNGNKASKSFPETIPEDSPLDDKQTINLPETAEAHNSTLNISSTAAKVPEHGSSRESISRDTMGFSSAEINANAGKVYRKKIRVDNKIQKYSVDISPGPENKNPLYSLKLFYDGKLVTEKVFRFAAFRDLYSQLNADKFCDQYLSAPFPVTHGFSKLGIKMSELQIEDRRSKLFSWWIDLLDNFDELSEQSKGLVSSYLSVPVADLMLIESSDDVLVHSQNDSQYTTSRDTESRDTVVVRDSVIEANSKKTYIKKVSNDNIYQRNTISIESKADGSNPLYILTISRSGKMIVQGSHRFGLHRDLYMAINTDKFCDKLLSAPFPITHSRQKLGIKLSDKEIEARRKGLEEWWTDIFDHFNNFPDSSKEKISDFVELAVSMLELVERPLDSVNKQTQGQTAAVAEVKPVSVSKTSIPEGKEEDDDDNAVDKQNEDDGEEWEKIESRTKPVAGCCTIS